MARLRALSVLITLFLAVFAVTSSAVALDSRAPRCKELCITRCNRVTAGQAGTPGQTLRSAAVAKGKYFGAAVSPNLFATAAYANALKKEYGWLTPGNAMKRDATEPAQGQFRFTDADAVLKQAQANGQMIRGHTLVWHSQLPAWVPNTAGTDIAKARAIMTNHSENSFPGQLAHWDVCNEVLNEDGTFRQSFWFNAWGGRRYVAEAFRLARAADPTVKLYINDFNVESPNGAKTNGFFNIVSSPIDGVGFQAHFISGQIPDIAATLKRFATLGVEVAITEPPPEQTQATNYAAVTNACKSVAVCVGVTVWGVEDTDSWVPHLLLDANYQKKASYTYTLNALNA
ncbi:glycoside hydrolase family 10 protein [Gonapodya prolifera JEL478]|uniref:Beta-xylanase n=1 Tax=Gonapodya prolifera (strain JEL478) TaxID=1344416 RepID=A0A139A8U4_GONPJ|nr:glycoside hydrolase family 10 protein [Gonapodya prolifera JEL478]|eukprot:KXS13210.1 glycoside hydrolase family 10 protein [Gonapodya prolifera JEL478]